MHGIGRSEGGMIEEWKGMTGWKKGWIKEVKRGDAASTLGRSKMEGSNAGFSRSHRDTQSCLTLDIFPSTIPPSLHASLLFHFPSSGNPGGYGNGDGLDARRARKGQRAQGKVSAKSMVKGGIA